MGVALDEAGQHRLPRRVYHGAAVQIVRVRLDLPDAVALDDDVDRVARAGATTVEEPSGVDGDGSGGLPRLPRQARHDVAHAAIVEADEAEPIGGLVQDAAGIRGPRGRAGEVGGEAAGRTSRGAVAQHRIGVQKAVDDRRHLAPVRRPDRPEVLAHADRRVRHRIEPAIRCEGIAAGAGWGRIDLHPQHLVRSLAEPRRVRLQGGHHDRTAVGRPARAPRLVQPLVDLAALEALHVHHPQLRGRIQEREPGAIGRPRRLLAARRQPAIGAGPQVAHPQVHLTAAVRRVGQRLAIGRPHRVHLDERVVGEPFRHGVAAAGRHRPEIAEGGERHARSIRRDRRVHHAPDRLRSFRREVAAPGRELGAGERHVRRERDRPGGAAGAGASLDHAVGGIDHVAAAGPVRAEREHILAGLAHGGATDDEPAVRAAHRHVGDGPAVRRPGRRPGGRRFGGQQAFGSRLYLARVDTPLGAVRDERDFAPVRRPGGHAVVGSVGRQAPHFPAGRRQDPDVVVTATVG